MDKQIRLRKIPLDEFIDTLLELYNDGVDYIDIVGNLGDKIDTVGIFIEDTYINSRNKKEGKSPVILKKKPLTDDDINQLLNTI